MLLMSSNITAEDVRHLFCSDPDLRKEAASRSAKRKTHSDLANWLYLDPQRICLADETEGVAASPAGKNIDNNIPSLPFEPTTHRPEKLIA